jgi:hypothetical protein
MYNYDLNGAFNRNEFVNNYLSLSSIDKQIKNADINQQKTSINIVSFNKSTIMNSWGSVSQNKKLESYDEICTYLKNVCDKINLKDNIQNSGKLKCEKTQSIDSSFNFNGNIPNKPWGHSKTITNKCIIKVCW